MLKKPRDSVTEDGGPAKAALDEPTEDAAKVHIPDQPIILIKSLPPDLVASELLQICKDEVQGFDRLIFSEPNPTKRMHRMAWVVLKKPEYVNANEDEDAEDGGQGRRPRNPVDKLIDNAISHLERATVSSFCFS